MKIVGVVVFGGKVSGWVVWWWEEISSSPRARAASQVREPVCPEDEMMLRDSMRVRESPSA